MTPGHFLWTQLNYGKYYRPNGLEPIDWWDQLPERRRREYEEAAAAMIEKAKAAP